MNNDDGSIIESDYVILALMRLVLSHLDLLTDNSLQSADKDQQEMRAVADKLHDAVVKFDTYRNVQRHRAVLPAIARLLLFTV